MNRKSSKLKNKAMYFNGLQVNFTGSNPVSLTIISSFGKHNKINYLACKPLKLKGYFIRAFPFCTELVLSTSQIIRSKIALFQTQIVCNRLSLFWQLFQTTNMANRVERKKTIFYLYKYAITHI